MALNANAITTSIVAKFRDLGIEDKVGTQPSNTARLVAVIVEEIIRGITSTAEVTTIVNTAGTPTNHTGTGYGSPGSIK